MKVSKTETENSMVQVITDANFEAETQEGVVIVDFWAPWCGPCRMQAPILEQLAEEVSEDELRIYKMDIDENPNIASQFGILSIPTLLFKKDGQVVKQVAGVHTKEQIKAILAEIG
ncbi:thioredoxin [Streptococcus ruminantium]|uniref:Thioredoxin n=2 Tax=Streptococcus ruminantium TaxID=1917441 RepID=A0A2Z5U288_9STRE|nr:thioredoxin [Streptococcus ruminantium]